MVAWSTYIRNLGTAAAPTVQGIKNLGFALLSDLGNAATRDVGTGPGTVAAGDDGRIEGALQRDQMGVCFPEDFGAIGDGVTDDTIAMQAAFNDGRIVHLRRGATYLVSFLRPRDNLVVRGTGAVTIKHKAGTNNNLIGPTFISGTTLETVTFDNVTFKGFILDGNKDNQELINANGLQNLIRGTYTNFEFSRLKLINSVRGDMRLSNCQDGVIRDCRFYGGGKWLGGMYDGSVAQHIAVVSAGTRNISITRNMFKGIGAEVYAAFPDYTIGINSVGVIIENEAFGVNVVDNDFIEQVNEAIEVVRWDVANPNVPDLANRPGKNIIALNRFDGNYKGMFGPNLGNNADNVIVSGNIVRRMNSHGMKISAYMRDCSIMGNMIEHCKGSGILVVTGAVGSVTEPFGAIKIQDNTIEFCDGNGIAAIGSLLETIVGMSIQDNLIRNNGQGGAGYAGIRLAVSVSDSLISGNNIYDDQDLKSGGAKTQDYGLLVQNSSGGTAAYARNMCANNKLVGNKTSSASIVSSAARAGFSFFGNVEGTAPQLYAAKVDYDLAASGNTASTAIGAAYKGKPLTTALVPRDDAGAVAAGAAFVSLNADASGSPFVQVRNLSPGSKAVGSAYVFAQ